MEGGLLFSHRHVLIFAVLMLVNVCLASCAVVMRETAGNGVGRLVEATGATPMVNNCFSLLRYIHSALFSGPPLAQ